MFHSLKKNFAKTTAPARGINPGGEFLDYKYRLSTIKKNLQYIDRRMEESMKFWNVRIIEQRNLSERFSNGYPIRGDETDKLVKDFEKGSAAIYDYFMRSSDAGEQPYVNMHAQVKLYIREITDIEKQYGALMFSRSEAERYQAKVDSMDRRGKKNDLKRTRNLQKMDHERLKLATMTKSIVAAQKEAYAKAPVIYKAALCSYWSAHECHTQVMSEKLSETADFAREAEEELANLDISQMLYAEPDGASDLSYDEAPASSEVDSVKVPANMRKHFGKVPSILPKSPQVESHPEKDIDLQVQMEVREEVTDPIAV